LEIAFPAAVDDDEETPLAEALAPITGPGAALAALADTDAALPFPEFGCTFAAAAAATPEFVGGAAGSLLASRSATRFSNSSTRSSNIRSRSVSPAGASIFTTAGFAELEFVALELAGVSEEELASAPFAALEFTAAEFLEPEFAAAEFVEVTFAPEGFAGAEFTGCSPSLLFFSSASKRPGTTPTESEASNSTHTHRTFRPNANIYLSCPATHGRHRRVVGARPRPTPRRSGNFVARQTVDVVWR
jgi:hypothetical protein